MLSHGRRLHLSLAIGLGSAALVTAALCACDDETAVSPAGNDGGQESSSPSDSGGTTTTTDAGTDTGGPSSPNDGGGDAAADAAPQMTTVVGSTGDIRIRHDAVIASFFEDDTIVRWSNAPDCVVFVRSVTKPQSPAGTLTIGGDIVASDGGPPQIITISADPDQGNQYTYFGPVFGYTDQLQVQVDGTAAVAFPALPLQMMRPPQANPITITKPEAPDGGELLVKSTQALQLTWTVPGGTIATGHEVMLGFHVQPGALGNKAASIFCGFPLSAGSGTVPANLLADVRARVGAGGSGIFYVIAGSQKEVVVGTTSYVIEVGRNGDSTTFMDVNGLLE